MSLQAVGQSAGIDDGLAAVIRCHWVRHAQTTPPLRRPVSKRQYWFCEASGKCNATGGKEYHDTVMKEEIDALSVRIERLLGLMKKLSGENARLRNELTGSKKQQADMEKRMNEARVRVEAALARLPLPADSQPEEAA